MFLMVTLRSASQLPPGEDVYAKPNAVELADDLPGVREIVNRFHGATPSRKAP
jgi:hypothetical protein